MQHKMKTGLNLVIMKIMVGYVSVNLLNSSSFVKHLISVLIARFHCNIQWKLDIKRSGGHFIKCFVSDFH